MAWIINLWVLSRLNNKLNTYQQLSFVTNSVKDSIRSNKEVCPFLPTFICQWLRVKRLYKPYSRVITSNFSPSVPSPSCSKLLTEINEPTLQLHLFKLNNWIATSTVCSEILPLPFCVRENSELSPNKDVKLPCE